MFSCKVCKEKDARIADLKEQIKAQHSQIVPEPKLRHYELEQDYVMDGGGTEELVPQTIAQVDQEKIDQEKAAVQLEYDQILSGSTW